ncbi:MAG: hypothetical protein RM021_017045 [Nostoc sp. EkiNYC01]
MTRYRFAIGVASYSPFKLSFVIGDRLRWAVTPKFNFLAECGNAC